jgi:ABC-type sulfate transport system permease subunit
MVFAGPAIVVVASFITLYLAIKIPDPVVSSYGQGNRSEAVKLGARSSTNMAPAMQARNHAATGVPAPAEP